MNCLEFRRVCQTDPYTQEKEFQEHIDACPKCKVYFNEVMEFECDLNEAFSIPVPESLESRIILRKSIEADKTSRHRSQIFFAIAATMMLAVGLTLSIFKPMVEPSLDQIVMDFYDRHNSELDMNQPTADKSMQTLLTEVGITVKENIGEVEYADRCYVREGQGIHVVVTGTNGPITLLFMPEESVNKRKLFADKEYHGLIVPCPRGSVAIIAPPDEDLEKIESRIFKSLEWI